MVHVVAHQANIEANLVFCARDRRAEKRLEASFPAWEEEELDLQAAIADDLSYNLRKRVALTWLMRPLRAATRTALAGEICCDNALPEVE